MLSARVSQARILLLAAIASIAAALTGACGDGSTTASPSPAAIETAEAMSRKVSFPADYSTTPVPADADRDEAIELQGRVFGDGPTGVILAHMRPADQSSWFPFATKLAATGEYTILTFDFRGYNGSTGEKEFDRVDTDLTAALHYMRDDLGIDKVFLVGASMGGTAALLVAAREPVAGIVSISSPARYQLLDALNTVSLITSPKLFITSEDDVPAQLSEEQLWVQAIEPKDRETFAGDAHGTDLFAAPVGSAFERRLMDFLSSH